jgi:hypothetical protein
MQKVIQFEKDGPELKKARNRYEKRYRPGKDDGILDSHYVSWLYFDLRFGKSRRTIAERVLDDPMTARLVEPGPTCLKHMAESYATFYEVIDPGPDVVVLNELGTGRHWNVLFFRELFGAPPGKGEVWYTRLLGPPERALSYTTPYVYEPETRAQFERGVRGLTNDYRKSQVSIGVPADRLFAESQKESALFWAEYIRVSNSPSRTMLSSVPSEWPGTRLPHLVNTDRDDIVLTEMHFRVKDEKAARRRLAALKSFDYDERDDTWTWLRVRSRGHRSRLSASRKADSSPRRIRGSGPPGSKPSSWVIYASFSSWRRRFIARWMTSRHGLRRNWRRVGRRTKSSTPAPKSRRPSVSTWKSIISRNGR